jgi:type II secretory pathway pseudopilin PulG
MRSLHPLEQQRPVQRCGGFVLLGLLIVLVLGGIGLMAAVDMWTLQRQREREAQLLFVGDQYRLAIQRYYYAAPPGSARTLPPSLQDLLEDQRYPHAVRHLRRLYPDPITGQPKWGELRVGERIAGVFSLSEAQPIKQAGFAFVYRHFADSTRYQQWVFSFMGANRPLTTPGASGSGGAEPPSMPRRPPSGITP